MREADRQRGIRERYEKGRGRTFSAPRFKISKMALLLVASTLFFSACCLGQEAGNALDLSSDVDEKKDSHNSSWFQQSIRRAIPFTIVSSTGLFRVFFFVG